MLIKSALIQLNNYTIDKFLDGITTATDIVILVIIGITVLQIAVLFAQLKLYSINNILNKQKKEIEDIDIIINDIKMKKNEELQLLREINENLKVLNVIVDKKQ